MKIKTDAKSYLPLSAQILLKVRYVLIFFLRVGSVVAYFSPFIGLKGIMNHWHAEKLPFVISEDQKQFDFWNSQTDEFQSVDIQELIRFSKDSSNTVFFCFLVICKLERAIAHCSKTLGRVGHITFSIIKI